MSYPNPWNSPRFFSTVKIGGREVMASLVEIDGIKIEDEWNEQRTTGTSGATNVFRGTKPAGPGKLIFEAVSPEEFDDLRELYELLAPKAGGGANGLGATAGSPGSAAYGQQFTQNRSTNSPTATTSADDLLRQAQQALAALQNGQAAPPVTATASTQVSALTPGPKPPTLSIENGYLNYVGINAISRKSWDGPKPTATNSYRVILEVVLQKEPRKAAVGAASPQTQDNPGQKALAFGEIQDPASSARDANRAAAQAGALP